MLFIMFAPWVAVLLLAALFLWGDDHGRDLDD